jgi:hypothetical protein
MTSDIGGVTGRPVRNLIKCGCVVACLGSLLAVNVRCERRQTPVKVQSVIKPDYLEIYGLTRQPDTAHPVEIVDSDGQKWYREIRPIIDLLRIDLAKADVGRTHTGGYGVYLLVQPPYVKQLRKWSADNVGQYSGVVIQGKLERPEKISGELDNLLLIALPSYEGAREVAATLRNGGVPVETPQKPTTTRASE